LKLSQILPGGCGGDERGTECGGVRDIEALDRGLENIRHELGDAVVFRCAAGEADAFGFHFHPLGMQAHVEELAF
jgi:hypothetical protein